VRRQKSMCSRAEAYELMIVDGDVSLLDETILQRTSQPT
jgi:hypothetical protein